jgi:hypothetical protein
MGLLYLLLYLKGDQFRVFFFKFKLQYLVTGKSVPVSAETG